jgi:hypothetical protein
MVFLGVVVTPPCHPGLMTDQLALLPSASPAKSVAASPPERAPVAVAADASWELDEHTRAVGRLGLAAARQALRAASAGLAA